MRAPLFAVAGLAVHVVIRTVASDDRVQRLGTVAALVALAMPLAALGQNLFGGEHDSAAARATLARGSLDGTRVDGRRLDRKFAAERE